MAESGRVLLSARIRDALHPPLDGAFYVSDPDGSLRYVAPDEGYLAPGQPYLYGAHRLTFAAADTALEQLLIHLDYGYRTALFRVSVPEPDGALLGAAAVVALRTLAAARRRLRSPG